MAEFTGERVIPGQVGEDLWDEHFARYAFASRLARRKRVLDAGCGAGYGSAELARAATQVVGLDVSANAVQYASEHYTIPSLHFVLGSCSALPFKDGSQDLVVAFEVIEHLADWRCFLQETRRVLAIGGQCVISTPNKSYYEDSRGAEGANPFHAHEFTFEEFREELRAVFPHVSLFLQNRSEGFVFQPVKIFSPAEARVDSGGGNPEDAHFFIAVCAMAAQTGAPTFLYIPKAANLLRQRELHIEKLAAELKTANRSVSELLEMFRQQKGELEERNRWAQQLDAELKDAGSVIRALQQEVAQVRAEASGKIVSLEQENEQKSAWALRVQEQLDACVIALHDVEKNLVERTNWALSLEEQVRTLESNLAELRSSRWMRMGSLLRMGPRLQND